MSKENKLNFMPNLSKIEARNYELYLKENSEMGARRVKLESGSIIIAWLKYKLFKVPNFKRLMDTICGTVDEGLLSLYWIDDRLFALDFDDKNKETKAEIKRLEETAETIRAMLWCLRKEATKMIKEGRCIDPEEEKKKYEKQSLYPKK